MRAWVSRPFRNVLGASLAAVALLAAHDVVAAAEGALSGHTARFRQGDRVLSILMVQTAFRTPVAQPTHHVLLVDTSASQAGRLRDYALGALEAYVAALPETDRVALMAIDVRAVPLHDGFVSPRSQQWHSAVRGLKRRVPLGAADLPAGVEAAAKRLDGVAGRRAVVYFGDGMSVANLAEPERVGRLADGLASRRVVFHALLAGDRIDWELPAIFAHHGGGMVLFGLPSVTDEDRSSELGRALADAARRPVFYPRQWTLEPDTPAVQSLRPLPLRSDRESVWLVEGDVPEKLVVTVQGQREGDDVTLTGTIDRDTRTPAEHWSFLVPLATRIARLQGPNPLAGRSVLGAYRNLYDVTVENMLTAARRSYFARDFARAEQLAAAILQVAPGHAGARSLANDVRKQTRSEAASATADRPGVEGSKGNACGCRSPVTSKKLGSWPLKTRRRRCRC